MGKNHKSTRRMKSLRAKFREACAAQVNDDGSVGAPCWLCPRPIDYDAAYDDWKNDWRFQLDHFYVVDDYPELQEDWDNFRASHAACNNRRSNKPPRPAIGNRSQSWV